MIFGAHVIVYSKDAAADRIFFRDVLGFASVDAGHGWLIFALPPAEAAVHPMDENGGHELYFMCDDLKTEISALEAKGHSVFGRARSPMGFDHQAPASRRRLSRPLPAEASNGIGTDLKLTHFRRSPPLDNHRSLSGVPRHRGLSARKCLQRSHQGSKPAARRQDRPTKVQIHA